MLVSMAFLRGGHPLGYGIVNLIILVLVYPISLFSSIVGLKTKVESVAESVKKYFLLVGVSLAFSLFASLLFALKFIFGKSI